jgi:hypothetical protein
MNTQELMICYEEIATTPDRNEQPIKFKMTVVSEEYIWELQHQIMALEQKVSDLEEELGQYRPSCYLFDPQTGVKYY